MKSYCKFNSSLGATLLPARDSRPARTRAGVDSVISRVLAVKLTAAMRANQVLDVFETVEMPMLASLVELELNGFGFSQTCSRILTKTVESQLGLIEQRIFEVAGSKFSISSPEAVGQVRDHNFYERIFFPIEK